MKLEVFSAGGSVLLKQHASKRQHLLPLQSFWARPRRLPAANPTGRSQEAAARTPAAGSGLICRHRRASAPETRGAGLSRGAETAGVQLAVRSRC